MVYASYRMYAFMRVRFHWSEDQTVLYNGIYGMANLPGTAIGALLGSAVI